MELLHTDEWAYDILEEPDALPHPVTDWEANFIENVLQRKPARLSSKQIEVIEKMKERYLA